MNLRLRVFGGAILLLSSTILAGCTAGGASYVKTQFTDADQRLTQAVDGGYRAYWDLIVPPATPVLTVRASILADQGLSFGLRNPAGRLTTYYDFPGPAEVPEMTWIESQRPMPGTWRLGIDCTRRCDYSFGFYLKDAVPRLEELKIEYEEAAHRFSEHADGNARRHNEFRVPAGTERLALRLSLDASQSVSLRLEDPQGHRRALTAFPGRSLVLDAQYLVMEAPPPGTWTFRADCRAGCAYDVGVFL